MANTQAMCTSFKGELLVGHHNFGTGVVRGATTADTFKAALYLASATVNASTTAYSATNEVSGTGYTAGGVTVTFGTAPSTSGTTAFVTPSASITYSAVTLSTAFDAVLIYNSTQGNKSVAVLDFGADKTTANATFLITFPTADASSAIVRIS